MSNNELDLAWRFVNYTGRHIFLTGKAGTGKTTFLHRVRTEGLKRAVVAAPTGVAAVNAKGVTLHSLFQLPFGVIDPERMPREGKFKFNKAKIELIRSMDLLIIDEVSMVRADVLDAVDRVLRRFRRADRVFGGVQVLMIGDMEQLPPVTKEDEWEILRRFYETPYFFSSKAFRESGALTIELKHIYRQEDETFIRLLNEVRQGRLSDQSLRLLQSRYRPDFEPGDDEGYILLTTHNYKADRLNRKKLEALPGDPVTYRAQIKGHFPENAYPAKEELVLKRGAQVMFLKNDRSGLRRYYNGKIGTVTDLDDDRVWVRPAGEDQIIEVEAETWENVRYKVDDRTGEILENKQGSFSQIPLRLAWAITIHKSQGLTFDKAIIDAELSFAHGQTYVALSRCRSLEGLVLKTPIRAGAFIRDRQIEDFGRQTARHTPGPGDLRDSVREFFFHITDEMLDISAARPLINRILQIYRKHPNSIEGEVEQTFGPMIREAVDPLTEVKDKFLAQLRRMAAQSADIQKDEAIRERIEKAIAYFRQETEEKLDKPFRAFSYTTENKQLEKDLDAVLEKLDRLFSEKMSVFQALDDGFSLEKYLEARARARAAKPAKRKKTKPVFSGRHADLCDLLRSYRWEQATGQDVPAFHIFTQKSLYDLCEKLPVTPRQLAEVHGFGRVRIERYGDDITDIIRSYCLANEIPLPEDPPPKKKKPDKSTYEISLEMFRQGLTPEQIARERQLTEETIWRHLSRFIPGGEVPLEALIAEERFAEIKKIWEAKEFQSLSEFKEYAGEDYTWRELRLVMDWMKREEKK